MYNATAKDQQYIMITYSDKADYTTVSVINEETRTLLNLAVWKDQSYKHDLILR